MAYVITQRCCNDASCIAECPVDCIRPAPGDRDFTTTEMLHIDPDTCIDCGACVDACPVDAIFSEDELARSLERYREINAAYFERHPLEPDLAPIVPQTRPAKDLGTLRVAVVGAGPAACYCAETLLRRAEVEVEMLEKLPTPFGLVRAGVAPDHAGTKGVTSLFESAFKRDVFQYRLNVEVGKHISHDELLAHHHAVVYAVGASTDRHLDIPGEDLPGSHAATEFVAWYNGHPDYADRSFDLSGDRAVIVGNGNVALDVARVLASPPGELAKTDIADHALQALRTSNIREVVLLGRRGPVQAAYSTPEFLALGYLKDVDIVIDERELELDAVSQAVLDDPDVEPSQQLKVDLAREYAGKPVDPGRRRLVFRYLVSPAEVLGSNRVEGVRVVRNVLDESGNAVATAAAEDIETGLLIRSVGYRGAPVDGLPFDERRGVVPNVEGRVVGEDGNPIPGVYVSGWIKRGPRGVIGSNKTDAEQTVEHILADFMAGALPAPAKGRAELTALIAGRQADVVDRDGWRAIDKVERERGKAAGRPRVKVTSIAEMIGITRR